jgi:hypothetical protein
MRRLVSASIAAVSLALLTACSAGGGGSSGGAPGGGASAPSCAQQKASFVDSMKTGYPDNPTAPANVDVASLALPKGVTMPKPDCAWQSKITVSSGSAVEGELWEAAVFYRSGQAKVIDGLKSQLKTAGCTDRTQDSLGEWFCNLDADDQHPAGWVIEYDLTGEVFDEIDISWQKS